MDFTYGFAKENRAITVRYGADPALFVMPFNAKSHAVAKIRLCGGDIGFTSALTYDFEVWSAAQKRWLEVSSVSLEEAAARFLTREDGGAWMADMYRLGARVRDLKRD